MFGLWSSTTRQQRPGTVPAGRRVYAVGDVHGRDDLLGELLAAIEADNDALPPATTSIVFLGDLIDRGPASAAVVERLRTYQPRGIRPLFLAGNHEEVLLRLIAGQDEFLADWLRFGGAECLASYGVDAAPLRRMRPARACAVVRGAIPPAHVEFLRSFADTYRIGGYLFVHAGIRPGLPLDQQSQSDLRWIRRPFLDDSSDHGFIVVHGHTISAEVEEAPNRIGIDTGAYHSGTLTALVAEGAGRRYLQTGGIAE